MRRYDELTGHMQRLEELKSLYQTQMAKERVQVQNRRRKQEEEEAAKRLDLRTFKVNNKSCRKTEANANRKRSTKCSATSSS